MGKKCWEKTKKKCPKFKNLSTLDWIVITLYITYLETWLKDDSGNIPEYSLRGAGVGLYGKNKKKGLVSQTKNSQPPVLSLEKVLYANNK